MTVLIKAAAVAAAGSVIALMLRRTAPELGLALGAAVTLLAAFLAAQGIGELGALVNELREKTGLSPAVTAPVLRCVGIGITARLASDLCRDAGQSAAASAVELCGAACALGAALPLIRSLLTLITELA